MSLSSPGLLSHKWKRRGADKAYLQRGGLQPKESLSKENFENAQWRKVCLDGGEFYKIGLQPNEGESAYRNLNLKNWNWGEEGEPVGENQGGSAECRALKTRRLRWSRGGGGDARSIWPRHIWQRCCVWHVTGETAHVIRSEKGRESICFNWRVQFINFS